MVWAVGAQYVHRHEVNTCLLMPPGVPVERGRILPGTSDCHKTAPPGLNQHSG